MAHERRRRGDRKNNNNRWLGTYGDMVTLLMAFFVMLYAMSSVDVAQFSAFVAGLVKPFSNEGSMSTAPDDSGLLPAYDGHGPAFSGPSEMGVAEEASSYAESRRRLEQLSNSLQEALEAAGLDTIVTQRPEERGVVISIATDDVLFELGSTEIDPRGRAIIGSLAGILSEFPNDVMIEGSTDDVPLRRQGYDNWNLSTDRAVAVLKLMAQEHGVPPQKLGAVGYGEFRPLVPNTSSANRAKNRRVDIVVLLPEGAPA